MELFRQGLAIPGTDDLRDAVLRELSEYYGYPIDECLARCINWESLSVQEWSAGDRSTTEGITRFYQEIQSWSFDLLWYALLQATAVEYPVQVVIVRDMPRRPGLRHLDFGSGVGVTSQLFRALGYETTLADISSPLLEFARHRLQRRGIEATYLDLKTESLPKNAYDVITAIDTLAHVPNVPATAAQLSAALRPGGLLIANFDVRTDVPEAKWHLYSDDLPLRWQLHRAGFEPVTNYDGMVRSYRAVDHGGVIGAYRYGRDSLLFRTPLRGMYRKVRTGIRR